MLCPETSIEDRKALDYFIARTSRQLIGTWGATRWTSSIVQCAISEPSIQRVSIALGALHSVHEYGRGSQQYALTQYVTALRMVRNNIARLQKVREVLLLACIMFCAFECMNYHLDSAMSHLSSGLQLVLQHALASTEGMVRHDTGLRSFLLPVLRMLDNDRLCLGAVSSQLMELTAFEIPHTFASVHEAQQLLTSVMNLSHRQLAAVNEGKTPLNPSAALQKTEQWSETFDSWLPSYVHRASDEEIINLLPVLSWRISIGAILNAEYAKGEMAWDALMPALKLVLACAEHFLDLTAEVVTDSEDWQHPLSYIKETSHERAQQTLTVEHGGQITEGLLAKLLVSRPALTPDDRSPLSIETSESITLSPTLVLLARARAIAERRHVTGRADLAARGNIQIRSTFTVSHGIVYPLFAVVCRCRDPLTRKRALRLLEACNRHEGLWDSKLAAQSVKRRMMVEETQALSEMRGNVDADEAGELEVTDANQIPNHCRVRATGRRFLPDGKVLERFCMGWKGTLREALESGEKERWIELSVLSA